MLLELLAFLPLAELAELSIPGRPRGGETHGPKATATLRAAGRGSGGPQEIQAATAARRASPALARTCARRDRIVMIPLGLRVSERMRHLAEVHEGVVIARAR